jgi:hypothetical protein
MNIHRAAVAALAAGSMLAGVMIGGAVMASSLSANAASPTSAGNVRLDRAGGVFTPNEDPAHEATESAEREAQEDAGQVPTVP